MDEADPVVPVEVLPRDQECRVKAGSQYYALLIRSKPDGHECSAEAELKIYDKQWRVVGRVRGISRVSDWDVRMSWDREGARLALVMQVSPGKALLAMVCPPDLESRTLDMLPADRLYTDPMWVGGTIVLAVARKGGKENAVVQFDADKGGGRDLWSEDARSDGHGPIEAALVSPDEAWIAFSRLPDSRYTKLGIWLLDTRLGGLAQVTSEDANRYYHGVRRWEASDRLLFMRRNYRDGGLDLYRAYLAKE